MSTYTSFKVRPQDAGYLSESRRFGSEKAARSFALKWSRRDLKRIIVVEGFEKVVAVYRGGRRTE